MSRRPSQRRQPLLWLAAWAVTWILIALTAGAWLDSRPARLHIRPAPAPGTSPTPLETP